MRDERRASDLKEQQLQFKANLSTRAGHIFQIFRKNCLEYKESVNRIVFQYKFTIKPVIFWLLHSQKYSKFSQKVRGLNNDLSCPLSVAWIKQQFILEAQLLCRYFSDFRCRNCPVFLSSSSFDLPFRKDVFSFG